MSASHKDLANFTQDLPSSAASLAAFTTCWLGKGIPFDSKPPAHLQTIPQCTRANVEHYNLFKMPRNAEDSALLKAHTIFCLSNHLTFTNYSTSTIQKTSLLQNQPIKVAY